jgi:hypothetical protein
LYATVFSGNLAGNASTATTLETTRTINGTSFNGSANITTANWGTARNIYIADSNGTNTGSAVSVNGSGNITLKLPSTIVATLSGKASYAGYIPLTYMSIGSTSSYTVLNAKDELTTLVATQATGVGQAIYVSASVINQWNNESATLYASNAFAMIKIGGAYVGSTYGQWLLSTYASNRVGIVGRDNDKWGSIKWFAWTEDIPTTLKNPYSLTAGSKTYDGSAAVTITAEDLGALTSH